MIFGFKKKRTAFTYKQGVSEFWRWFPQVADRFFQTIERGQCAALTAEVVDAVERMLPTMSWVFGPGENGGHSFTVTGEGVLVKQLLAKYWHSQAPHVPQWKFYASRQPSRPEQLKDMAIKFLNNGGRLSDNPLQWTGAALAYIAIDGAVFPDGRQVDVRGEIEERIQAALEKGRNGEVLGGAFGTRKSYIDLLFFDVDESRRTVEATIRQMRLPGNWSIERFV